MVDNFSNMLMSQYNRDDSSKAISNALIAGGAAWGSHKGVGTGMGDAIGAFGPEYLRSTQAENERKDKLMGQYMALGMSGAGLQMQAQKLGIDAAEFKAKAPVLAAQARLYNAKANAPIGGTGAGSVPPNVYFEQKNAFTGYKTMPTSAPFYKLDTTIQTNNGPVTWSKEDRKYLEKAPDSPSGQAAMKKWNTIVDYEFNSGLSTAKALNTKLPMQLNSDL